MAWDMKAVDAPASAVKLELDEIPDDVKTGVDEAIAFCNENATQRLIVPFSDEDERDEAKVQIRNYCEFRPAGRLTASMWTGFTGTEEVDGVKVDRFSQQASTVCTIPALSLRVKAYVKKSRTNGDSSE